LPECNARWIIGHSPHPMPAAPVNPGKPSEIPRNEPLANVILALADLRRSAALLEAALMD